MVFPVVKAVNAVFVLFQKAALHQGGNELVRILALPTGFQGNVGFVHALQNAVGVVHGRGNPQVDKVIRGTGAEQETQPPALSVAPERYGKANVAIH